MLYTTEKRQIEWITRFPHFLSNPVESLPPSIEQNLDSISNLSIDPNTVKELFMFKPKTIYLNHGSFGSIPKVVRALSQSWTEEYDQGPVEFMTGKLPGWIMQQVKATADFIHAKPDHVVLLSNATTATASVIRSTKIQKGDIIVTLNVMYNAVRTTLEQIKIETGCELDVIELQLPSSQAEIVETIEKHLKQCQKKPKLAIFDHITSATGLVLPVKEICALLRSYGIKSAIDGAHAAGNISIDMKEIDADFYFSNLHKWAFAPIGCAFMYVKENMDKMVPSLVSHGYTFGFHAVFGFVGTIDYTPFLCIKGGLEFHKHFRKERNHELCLLTARYLKECFNGFTLFENDSFQDEQLIGSMALICFPSIRSDKLKIVKREPFDPLLLCSKDNLVEPLDAKDLAVLIHDHLLYEYGIESFWVPFQSQVALRISVQVYNTAVNDVNKEDFVYLAKSLNEILYDQKLGDTPLVLKYLRDANNISLLKK